MMMFSRAASRRLMRPAAAASSSHSARWLSPNSAAAAGWKSIWQYRAGLAKYAVAAATGVALVSATWTADAVHAEGLVPDAKMLRRIRRENTDRSITTTNWHYYEGSATLRNFVLLTGNSNPSLCNQIARYLGIQRAPAKVANYTDGETAVEIKVNTSGKHVVIVQSMSPPTNDNIIELLLMVSAVRRDNAKHVTLVIPYFGYGRQDTPRNLETGSYGRDYDSFSPISAADVALMISQSGVDRVLTLDLHSPQITGFFPPTVAHDSLQCAGIGAYYLTEEYSFDDLQVVRADASTETDYAIAQHFANMLSRIGKIDVQIALVVNRNRADSFQPTKKKKKTPKATDAETEQRLRRWSESKEIVGDVDGSDVIIIHKAITSGKRLSEAAQLLKDHGAKRIFAFATHGLFLDKSFDVIEKSPLTKVVVTNSVQPSGDYCSKLKVLSVAPFLAEAIRRVHEKRSLSKLRINEW